MALRRLYKARARRRRFQFSLRTLLITVLGIGLARWAFGTESFQRWRERWLGRVVSGWIDRLLRRIRVAAWKFRRPARSDTPEVADE